METSNFKFKHLHLCLPYLHQYPGGFVTGKVLVYWVNYDDSRDDATFLVEFRERKHLANDFIKVVHNDGTALSRVLLEIVEFFLEHSDFCLMSNCE